MTTADQIEACYNLIINPNNITSTIVYSAFFIFMAVFAFMKKSIPGTFMTIARGIVNIFKKK
jgi:hypothetical protein